jgi:hypothetical protein
VWLCVIYGSASFGALGPKSDIDVLAEGYANAIAAWAAEAEQVTGREVNVSGVDYMLRQPMMVQQILDTPIVLRDSRNRLEDMQRALDEGGRLRAFHVRILGEALDEFPQDGPDRAITAPEQRYIEALAGVRHEYRKVIEGRTALDRQWAVERLTRRIRNLLRNWPDHGNYIEPREAIEKLAGELDERTREVLRELPYEHARADPVDVAIDPAWTEAQAQIAEVAEDLIAAAARALRASLRAESST